MPIYISNLDQPCIQIEYIYPTRYLSQTGPIFQIAKVIRKKKQPALTIDPSKTAKQACKSAQHCHPRLKPPIGELRGMMHRNLGMLCF